jgi:hypothetical protein
MRITIDNIDQPKVLLYVMAYLQLFNQLLDAGFTIFGGALRDIMILYFKKYQIYKSKKYLEDFCATIEDVKYILKTRGPLFLNDIDVATSINKYNMKLDGWKVYTKISTKRNNYYSRRDIYGRNCVRNEVYFEQKTMINMSNRFIKVDLVNNLEELPPDFSVNALLFSKKKGLRAHCLSPFTVMKSVNDILLKIAVPCVNISEYFNMNNATAFRLMKIMKKGFAFSPKEQFYTFRAAGNIHFPFREEELKSRCEICGIHGKPCATRYNGSSFKCDSIVIMVHCRHSLHFKCMIDVNGIQNCQICKEYLYGIEKIQKKFPKEITKIICSFLWRL